MKTKLIGIIICMLLIATAIPVIGHVKNISIIKDNDEINPTNNGEKWMKTFGGPQSDVGNSVLQTSDGGYIVCGDTLNFGSGGEDIWLIKTDSNGNIIWEKLFGGDSTDGGNSIQHTRDGGYIIAGKTYSYGVGGSDIWLIKIDADGNKLWDKTYGGNDFDIAYDVKQTNDDGYIIIGVTVSYGAGERDIYLVKTDSDGNQLWEKTFGGNDYDRGESVQQTPEGGYILAGWTASYGAGEFDFWLIKTDSAGELQWDKTFGGTGYDYGHSVLNTDDGGYIITGETESKGADSFDVWLIKTDSNGGLQWDKTFGRFGWERGNSIQKTNDGGYIICGDGPNNIKLDAKLIKTNSFGEKEWSKYYGGSGSDVALSVKQTNDGGYILSGFKASGLYHDLWLVKTDSNGDAPSGKSRDLCRSRLFELFLDLFPILRKILLLQR
ncbi:MAG: hypothetical protein ACFFDN_03900 [Candidatus Hodarchaeota archaeon]